MKKVTTARDINGHDMKKGDMVTTLHGEMTGRVCDLAMEDGMEFVQLRPIYQPYGIGVWHSADRVIFAAAGRKRTRSQTTDN